ncbi:Rossmann-like and DUF2520 domain-containing protein [Robiginitalea sediminis]|uniref:Rossmann-like and DUF2520 domain-containing protein n=1 Tax=Robiginitalea sediminis TaxID=1982593 RepID=UPI001302F982|nr:DUF2520 domain-containing protein [Robiginitalea sediminis]
MIHVALIGSGNLAHHLGKALWEADGIVLTHWMARDPGKITFTPEGLSVGLIGIPREAQLVLVAISDRAIATVSRQLEGYTGLLAHTSGATAMDAFPKSVHAGVFYPIQTFSPGSGVSLEGVPVLIEAQRAADRVLLSELAQALGCLPAQADSTQRLRVHLAAVFANNFTNHMATLAQAYCRDHNLDPGLLGPLLQETCRKWQAMPAREAQTGPARRADAPTLAAHRNLLENSPLLPVYEQLTESIQSMYETKL